MSGMAMVASLDSSFLPCPTNIFGVGPAARRHGSDCCVPRAAVQLMARAAAERLYSLGPSGPTAARGHVSQDERACTIGTQEDLKLRELRAAGSAT